MTADIKRVVSVLQFTQADIESVVAQSAQRPEVLCGTVCFTFPTNQIKIWRKEKPDTCLGGEMMNFLLFLFFPSPQCLCYYCHVCRGPNGRLLSHIIIIVDPLLMAQRKD